MINDRCRMIYTGVFMMSGKHVTSGRPSFCPAPAIVIGRSELYGICNPSVCYGIWHSERMREYTRRFAAYLYEYRRLLTP